MGSDQPVQMMKEPVSYNMGNVESSDAVMPGSFTGDDIDYYWQPGFFTGNDVDCHRRPSTGTSAVNSEAAPLEVTTLPLEEDVAALDASQVDWRDYEPPSALRDTSGLTSQILRDLVSSSINNIKARNHQEKQEQLAAAEREAAVKAEAEQTIDKGKAPYLPILIVSEHPDPIDEAIESRRSSSSEDSFSVACSVTSSVDRTKERPAGATRKSAFRRLFRRNAEKGESSADGSAREAILQKLAAASSSHETANVVPKSALALKTVRFAEPEETDECVSCLDDFPQGTGVRVVCHNYCNDCFVRLITTACQNELQWPPKCCLNEIPASLIRKSIPSTLKKTYNERLTEWELPVSERIYCFRADCSLFIRPKRLSPGVNLGKCDRGHWTCTICRGERHAGRDCPQDQEMALTNQIAEEEGWMRCFNCHALVEHGEACQHMTCRCGTDFCYVCGLVWRTCNCTMLDLDRVKSRARERREEREQREALESEELREILAQIEEYEREEALKAELLLQEQIRQEEERQRLELMERIRAETARREEVDIKFRGLREDLAALHDLQRVLLQQDHDEAVTNHSSAAKRDADNLEDKYRRKIAAMEADIETKVAAKSAVFDKELKARVAAEAEVEATYHGQLQEYWKHVEDGDFRVESAMLSLRRRMDKHFRSWESWRNDELITYRDMLEDERVVQEELMHSTLALMRDRVLEKRLVLGLREIADRKWIEAVIDERKKMLAQIETDEIEGGADGLLPLDRAEGEQPPAWPLPDN